jgi:hypothetical protein
MVCGDEVCNDDFHIRQDMVNTRDARFLFQQTHAINAQNGVGDGFPTALNPRGDPVPIHGIGHDNLPPVMAEPMKIISSVSATRR